jgi:eukaryotic-like serine/threonine-protein kinase
VADVRGWDAPDAVAELQERDLEVTTRERHHDEVTEGAVIAQDPPPETMADEQSTVVLTVSLGPEPVAVPDLRGDALPDAVQLARERRLEVEVVERRNHDRVPEGHVIAQRPDPGVQLLPGETIEVAVSEGPAPIEVPSVRNQHVDEAEATLRERGFEVSIDWRGGFGALLQPGRVLDQDPAPGGQRLPGSTITLFAYER